jgi:hypothetical protein
MAMADWHKTASALQAKIPEPVPGEARPPRIAFLQT